MSRSPAAPGWLVVLASLVTGCARGAVPSLSAASRRPAPTVQFTDVTERAGIHFKHFNGAAAHRYLVETMGAGGAFLDYDGDGWDDILLLNGKPLQPTGGHLKSKIQTPRGHPKSKIPTAALYHNNHDGTFTDVTRGSGLDVPLYAMGCAVGDYDNDGRDDLYVTCTLESSHLFHNEGSGRFKDVTARARVDDQRKFGTSCAWVDYDNDGWLDLFVCNYVRYSLATDHPCYEGGRRYYCRPNVYKPDTCLLYHNNGDGTFADVTKQANIWNKSGNSLGVAVWDFDGDGWPDIVVANDLTPNYLFHNVAAAGPSGGERESAKGRKREIERDGKRTGPGESTGFDSNRISRFRPEGSRLRDISRSHRKEHAGPARRFEEVGLDWGVAFGEDARARAGMGIDVADYRNDGRPAILISNFTGEPLSFFVEDAPDQFSDVAFEVGLGEAHLRFLGFGLFFFDYDNDGNKDAFVGNGHIEPSIADFGEGVTYAERNQLFRNLGNGTFAEVGPSAGPPFAYRRVTRGAAYSDSDNDGDLDILIANNGQPAELLRNDGGNSRNWLQVDLRGRGPGGAGPGSNRDGIGARVTVRAGTMIQRDFIRSGSSYCSQSMLRRHFGLGSAAAADEVEVRWPSGIVDRVGPVKANQRITVVEGQGVQPR